MAAAAREMGDRLPKIVMLAALFIMNSASLRTSLEFSFGKSSFEQKRFFEKMIKVIY
jgi:hypothetical protein